MSALAISSKPVSISEFKIITDKYLTVKEISKEEIETLTSSQESLFEEEDDVVVVVQVDNTQTAVRPELTVEVLVRCVKAVTDLVS